jgi:hypothetical protein
MSDLTWTGVMPGERSRLPRRRIQDGERERMIEFAVLLRPPTR